MFELQNLSFNEKTNTLTIRLDPLLSEFSLELKGDKLSKKQAVSLHQFIRRTIQEKMKGAHIRTVKVMVGTVVITTLYLYPTDVEAATDFNMGYLYYGSPNTQISFVDQTESVINQTSPSYFDIYEDGSLDTSNLSEIFISDMNRRGIKVVPFLSNHWDRELGRAALENREVLAQQIADSIAKYNLDGVNVDIENVTEIDRDNYTDLVRLLREKLPEDKEVSVAVAANPSNWTKGWHGSYDYKKLAEYADYLMIMAYDESWYGSAPGPVASISFVDRSIQYAFANGVPNEKIVLGLPHYGRYWLEGQSIGGTGITNQRIQEMLTKYQSSITFDEKSQSPKATVTIKQEDPVMYINNKALVPGTYTIWYENEQSIKAKVNLINNYGLKGTGNWALGQENQLLWPAFKTWLPQEEQVTDSKIALTTTTANMRTNSSLSGPILKTIYSSNIIQIIGEIINQNWYPVKLTDGTRGYMESDLLKPLQVREIQGETRYGTSVAVSNSGWEETSDYVVLGRGDNPIDSLTGSVLAKKYNSPLLLTKTDFLPSEISTEISRLNPKHVIVLGGESAISSAVVKDLESRGINVKRISGENRYATATNIATEVGTTNEIFLTTGDNSPDPLSIAPYASMKQIPILLTKTDSLTSEVKKMIQNGNIAKVTIIGGENVVSANIQDQLKSIGVSQVNRISGPDRYATSVEIANNFKAEFDISNVYFTSGQSYVDALSGSPLAAIQKAPVILVDKDKLPSTVSNWIANNMSSDITKVNFLGGSDVIGENNRLNVYKQMK
ncbi:MULTISPECIES: cell wall-binding repeat-containing protein [Paraliobacillus]|uniref:cell wall-binding repeat-containing protein n=1 Tax=Paraliobacillus TaxID=200903 RepID=UPI000DD4A5E9|nr:MULTISPECIES: cell wall-binding repeat-containing protein [Paraliobacillus]